MEILARLTREFAYNAWANAEVLRSLFAARTVPERAAEVMAHVVGAEWLFLRRLGQVAPNVPVWPALSLAECEQHLTQLARAWCSYLGGLAPGALTQQIGYTNSKGENWSNTVTDILTHVVLHSSYHRGQIATLLGRASSYSDYIEWARRGYLAGGRPSETEV